MATNFVEIKVESIVGRNFETVCRTCLLDEVAVTAISATLNNHTKNICDLLQFCTNINVNVNDNLPKNMCTTCISDLEKTYQFITKCQNSDSLLHSTETIMFQTNADETIINGTIKEEKEYKDIKILELNNINDTTDASNQSDEQITKFEHDSVKDVKSKITKRSKSFKPKSKTCSIDRISDRTCSICSKVFASPYCLKEHIRSHTKEKPYQCNLCSASFMNSSNLKRHIGTHTGKKYVCDICNNAYTQSTTLLNHRRIHTGEKPYICHICGEGFRTYNLHGSHLMKHYRGNNSRTENDKEIRKYYDNVTCNLCDHTFSCKTALQTHKLTKHENKHFLCYNCDQGFLTKASLDTHLNSHTGKKSQVCNKD